MLACFQTRPEEVDTVMNTVDDCVLIYHTDMRALSTVVDVAAAADRFYPSRMLHRPTVSITIIEAYAVKLASPWQTLLEATDY